MAKAQSFGDKTKKKAVDTRIAVKVIKGYRSESGSIRFIERLVKVDDINQVEKMDLRK